ncbi:tyrosine-type recombinase/integrase [Flexithrix dorotheae]|uniref:tyrosine-type recombinase/integrase n=1 Tax=Flexithrix dorotheae TaxID=70993 RepID=UPI000365562F|nr:tyrosine-type recombinase/integrase [Flexithrix dorotheae]
MKNLTESLVIAKAMREWEKVYLPEIRVLSNHTLRSYHEAVTLYAIFMKDIKSIDCDNLSGDTFSIANIHEWMLWLKKERSCSNSTCNQRLAGLKNFLKFLSKKDSRFIQMGMEAKEIKQMRYIRPAQVEITQETIKAIFNVIDLKTKIGKRDFTLFYLIYSIGARIGEVLSLKISDIYLNEPNGKNYIAILGKGAKRRSPPILKEVALVLKGYIEMFHGKQPNLGDPLFFVHFDGRKKKITQEGVNKRLKKYAKKAHCFNPEVPDNLHCHQLRHARASHWLEQHLNIVAIQRLMGHADINTTMQYIFVSTEQKNQALATLEDDVITDTGKKWKNIRKKKDLLEYLGLKE